MNADLHSHSCFSDGALTPSDLILRAQEKGVDLFALTDHDTLGGLALAIETASDIRLPFLTGVEISVSWQDTTLHIVGLGIDHKSQQLIDGLKKTRQGRIERAKKIAESLASAGITGAFDGAMQFVSDPQSISRTHFARFLVETGVCDSTSSVFNRYLVRGRPGYVPMQWASLEEAITWITQSGGVAVIAHPGRYKILPKTMSALLREFQRLGGGGIEVVTSSHGDDQVRRFAHWCKISGLYASRGSDFHAPQESHVELGAVPDLPHHVKPVWEHPRLQL